MKRKTKEFRKFTHDLHEFIISDSQFRQDTSSRSESEIQAEIRPLIIKYLEQYFKKSGYKDCTAKAHRSFYWEAQEGEYGKKRATTFSSRNYPDFIITSPYLLAVEYKQGTNGSLVKQAIGQSMMHTLSGDFDYVYVLFHDENTDKRIEHSIIQDKEKIIINKIWDDFNVLLKFV